MFNFFEKRRQKRRDAERAADWDEYQKQEAEKARIAAENEKAENAIRTRAYAVADQMIENTRETLDTGAKQENYTQRLIRDSVHELLKSGTVSEERFQKLAVDWKGLDMNTLFHSVQSMCNFQRQLAQAYAAKLLEQHEYDTLHSSIAIVDTEILWERLAERKLVPTLTVIDYGATGAKSKRN